MATQYTGGSHNAIDHGPKTASDLATPRSRNPPYFPTRLERLVTAIFPILLVFGTLFSAISPQTRGAIYDPSQQAHAQDAALVPSYFARKSNLFNVVFVKRGWAWTTLALLVFTVSHPSVASRSRVGLRWAAMTVCWILVTQWCFGAPVIDRSFRWTGGRCDMAEREISRDGSADAGMADVLTAMACRTAGGHWKGGHDISGHVFLLVLGTAMLLQEVGWPLLRWTGITEERTIVMSDGAVKGAGVEADTAPGRGRGKFKLGVGGKTALAVGSLNVWMLLMTAIYFHTWVEKLTGLLTALVAVYAVYIVPRFMPVIRAVLALPGI
ncbi:hypothetical protein CDD82_2691 [Ophiocordyceps australis]|uniref:Acyl-coenzyme A diphosphatase SCS3 n=1 Tax=Ophiocordyceps australis TaxID=1399860 RepID=A0A2C5ZV77_9HYPO|nr:hypothetical protein CDD82_2691 [Ophiocordyceps australis]